METLKNFYPLYTLKLSTADLYSISKSTLIYSLPVKESMSDLMKAALTQLETDNQAMYAALHKPLKSGLTPMLKIKGTERKDCIAEIKRNIKTDSKSSDERKKSAGAALLIFMEPYWDTEKKAMDTATNVFSEMIEKINADETLSTHAAAIGISDLILKLDTINKEFALLYQTRNTHEASQTGPSASSLKQPLAKSYEQFCNALQLAVNFVPTGTLLDLFSQIDELRVKYARLVSKPEEENDSTPAEQQTE